MRIYLKDGRYADVFVQTNNSGVHEFYLDDILIGVFDPKIMKNNFLKIDLERNNTILNELSGESKDELLNVVSEIAEAIEEISKGKIEEEAKINENIGNYLEQIGMEKAIVKDVTKMKLEPEKEQKIESKDDKVPSKIVEFDRRSFNVKQTINLDEKVTDSETMRQWLGSKLPPECKDVIVIPREQMIKMKDENGNVIDNSTTTYGFAVVDKNNKVRPLKEYLPQLEQNHSAGNNPTEATTQVETDGRVEKDAVISEYRFGPKKVQVDQDSGVGDKFEVNLGKISSTSNKAVTVETRGSDTTFRTEKEVRGIVETRGEGVRAAQSRSDEAMSHEKVGCKPEELTYREVDGKEETGHQHIAENEGAKTVQITDMYLEHFAKEVLDTTDLGDTYNRADVKKELLKIADGKDITKMTEEEQEKLISDTKEEMSEKGRYEKTPDIDFDYGKRIS